VEIGLNKKINKTEKTGIVHEVKKTFYSNISATISFMATYFLEKSHVVICWITETVLETRPSLIIVCITYIIFFE
jgi:hypothetical protein